MMQPDGYHAQVNNLLVVDRRRMRVLSIVLQGCNNNSGSATYDVEGRGVVEEALVGRV